MKEIPEILLIDKPKGITSFDVIRQLRKKLNTRKIGHAGTLDPLATGLMILGVNAGTKKLGEYLKLPKVYYTDILLGKQTETGDLEGKVIERKKIDESLKTQEVEDVLGSFLGKHTFKVPVYSAIKVDGKPLYWYARNNIEPSRIPEKEMTVHEISLLDSYRSDEYWVLRVRIHVGSGTYIRILGEEIGKALGYPAVLKTLRRTSIGDFDIKNALSLDEM